MKLYNTDETPPLSELTVGVWGLGKMGLPLACVLADHGATVRGVDIDSTIVEAVNDGKSPLDGEPGVPGLVKQYSGDRFVATTHGNRVADIVDVAIILVPTVLDDANEPDLAPVIAAAEDIATGLDPADLVVLESTAPPGTTDGVLRETLESSGHDAGDSFGLAFCPERTSSGQVVRDLTESYPKIIGGVDAESTAAAAGLYRQFNEPGVIEMDSATAAEAVKVFEGVYRDVNIALANELGKICVEWGLDADHVFDAANSQPYCEIHDPGIGVGGHCIPVYPHFVMNCASDARLVGTAREINEEMPRHAIDLLESRLTSHGRLLDTANVLLLGVAYRPGVDEVRYAPSLAAIEQLQQAGATVYAHDPVVADETIADAGATAVSDPLAVDELDGIVLATGHGEYRTLPLADLAAGMRTPVFVDGRRFFSAEELDSFDAVAIGRP